MLENVVSRVSSLEWLSSYLWAVLYVINNARPVAFCFLQVGRKVSTSGRTSFGGDVYTIRKWTRNLRTKIRKCVRQWKENNRATNAAFQMSHQMSQPKKLSSQTMHVFLSHSRVCSVIVCAMFCLRHVETESETLRTARFLCVLYAEICVKWPLFDTRYFMNVHMHVVLNWICTLESSAKWCSQPFLLSW